MIDFIHASHDSLFFRGKCCNAWTVVSFCFLKMLAILAVAICVASWCDAQTSDVAAESAPIDLNLRLSWGGPKPANYVGTIELDSGMLIASQQLGIDPNDPSFMLKDPNGRILVDDRETRFGGCDIRVQAKSNSRLKVQLEVTDPESSQSVIKEYSWSLKSLRDNTDLQSLGIDQCRLSVDRVPGDRLRVVTPRSHLVYNSEEPLSIQIQPYGLSWSSINANLECTLVRLEDDHHLYKKSKAIHVDGRGQGEPYDVLGTAPKEEGVYELRFKLEPKRMLPGLLIKQASVERVVQFVVYNSISTSRHSSPRSHDEEASSRWRTQLELPLKSFETQTLTATLMSRIETARRYPLFDFAKSLSIVPKETHSDPSAEANEERLNLLPGSIASMNITGLVPGRLHRLKLSTASHRDTFRVNLTSSGIRDSKQTSDTLILETFDATSRGAIAELTGATGIPDGERMEVLFWPTSRNAKLEVTNLNAIQPLGISKVSVDAWQEEAVPSAHGKENDATASSVLELHSSNIRNAFGPVANGNSTSSGNSESSQNYDDWQVYLKFAHQIALYCNANGFECLSLNVHSQGATLFPSSKLSSNARFDTGTFSADGRDPLRKDVVELLYRVLSRHDIQFVPLLELDSPLREIEEARTRTDNRDLLQRREELQTARRNEDNPYNPLAPRVQQAIATALDEFESRYRSHSQYHGFALRASSYSHLDVSLPIDQTNKLILDQFAASVGGNLPKDLSQREQFLSQRLQNVYSQWLKENVANYLGKLRAKPRWISLETGRPTNPTNPNDTVPRMIAPVCVGPTPNMDFLQAKSTITSQWNFGEPGPIHIAMEKPFHRVESEFVRFLSLSKHNQHQTIRSLPYRDASRSVSKVRVWIAKDHTHSLFISNAGAVPETIHVSWDELPTNHSIYSSQDLPTTQQPLIQMDLAAKEWVMQIGAGEVQRIECKDNFFSPLSWYSREADTTRQIEVALQSLEQAITRLSTPQTRSATLSNSSFEMQSNSLRRGRLTGWTTSIDPNTNVEVDSSVASDGRASIKLETNSAASIAWLQSDPFALPTTDRLNVSIQAMADQVPSNLSLMLLRFDTKSERFENIAVREFADRVTKPIEPSKWGSIGFDLSKELQSTSKADEPALYRLQIESRGIGRVWLDAISVSTSFLRETERRDLRSELFLARTSLQNGDSGPAVTMLNSPRGRLVQWGDAFIPKSSVFVSVRNGNSEGTAENSSVNSIVPRVDLRPKSEPLNDTKASDPKRRPIQRLRNSWWPR